MGRVSDARERLIAAAIDLVWREGCAAVSVDALCERADVRKGSFYHFFPSKDDLIVEALEAHWQARRPILDRLFSVTEAPLDRLSNYFDNVYKRQCEIKSKTGQYLGCFFSAVGAAAPSPRVAKKVQELLANYEKYYESALRDLARDGRLPPAEVRRKAQSLFAYMEGVLAQARIQDDPEIIRNLRASALAFLGVESARGRAQRGARRAAR